MLGVIKREIREKTEIDKGVILNSGGRPGHYHFIGTERLLSDEQFITFMALCLGMNEQGKFLVDGEWVGHSLNPLKYMVQFDKEYGLEPRSKYDFRLRFATLRITTSEEKPQLPVVVDVL